MKRLAIISLDGVSWEMLQPALDKGKLPFIHQLIQKGFSSVLQTHSFISSGSTWPSIHTGTHPGDHGIFFSHRQLKSGTYEITKKQAEDVPFKGFWQVVSESGIPVIAMDLPKAPRVRTFNGLVLNSWGEEAPWYSPSYPKNLKKEIHAKLGKHPLQEFYHRKMSDAASWKRLSEKHYSALEQRFDVLNYLMDKQSDWQLMIMAVNEIHLAAHLFWHLIDESHDEYDKDIRADVGNVIENLLIIADNRMSAISDQNEEIEWLLTSNNGMDRSHNPASIMDILLKKMGFMEGVIPEDGQFARGSHNIVQEMEKVLPMNIVEWVKARMPKKLWYKVTRRLTYSTTDWKKSKAFPVPNDVSGAIRINLQGREPQGKVAQEEYDQVCDAIEAEMKTLTLNKTGKPAVRKIIRPQRDFNGENVNELADILVLWNASEPITSLESDIIGSINTKEDKRSGAHTDKGIFIADERLMEEALFEKVDPTQDLSIYPAVLKYFGIKNEMKIKNN